MKNIIIDNYTTNNYIIIRENDKELFKINKNNNITDLINMLYNKENNYNYKYINIFSYFNNIFSDLIIDKKNIEQLKKYNVVYVYFDYEENTLNIQVENKL